MPWSVNHYFAAWRLMDAVCRKATEEELLALEEKLLRRREACPDWCVCRRDPELPLAEDPKTP